MVNDILDQTDYYKTKKLKKVSKQELYSKADIITIHTPLTEETVNLIRKDTIAMMKPSTIVINTARGEIVNLKDLKEALKSGDIGGAALDVYDTEPPTDKELIQIPNLMNTPHIGGNAHEAVIAMGDAAIENIEQGFL